MYLQDLELKNNTVLLRVDFNVPLNDKYEITDDTRMQRAIPTLKFLIEKGCKLIIMSHLGRPQKMLKDDGTVNVEKFTLKHLVSHLSDLTGINTAFCPSHDINEMSAATKDLGFGEILLLENTRFHKGETKGDEHFAKDLASLADVFVNDAFGTAHRAHSSTTIVARYFDNMHKSFGLLMEAEIKNANRVLNGAESPVTAIIGGAKVSDKIKLIEKLLDISDNIIIGGGMAYTFKKALGGEVGNSLCEDDYLDLAKTLIEKAAIANTKICLPEDSVSADAFSNDANIKVCNSDAIEDGWMGLDIGPKAIEFYSKVISDSKTILWNGPMGVFEMSNFSKGTFTVAQEVANATQKGAFSLIGGGDSVAAINKAKLSDKVSHVSTGGGAMLEFLEGKPLPGIRAITS